MSDTPPFDRVSFFDGKLLTAADLNSEQEYVRGKQKLHNRALHGFGIVSGLDVSSGGGKVVLAPGLALDCEGNEIVITAPQVFDPPCQTEQARTAYVNLRYAEVTADPVCNASDTTTRGVATIRESFEISFEQENCNRGHRHLRARWLACGQPHALTIAKLKQHSQGWRVDRGYRAPVIK